MQELQVMNIQMRIITEDNVDQLTSMNYSNTVDIMKEIKLSDAQKADLYKEDVIVKKEELEKEGKEKEELKKEELVEGEEDDEEEEEEDDEEGLSQVTKDSIRKAEEEYERYKDVEDEDSDEEETKPPITIGEQINDALGSFVEVISGKPKEESKKYKENYPENNFPCPEQSHLEQLFQNEEMSA